MNTKQLKREHPHTDVNPKYRCRAVVNKDGKQCGKPIKTRLIIQKQSTPIFCYNHYKTTKQEKPNG